MYNVIIIKCIILTTNEKCVRIIFSKMAKIYILTMLFSILRKKKNKIETQYYNKPVF